MFANTMETIFPELTGLFQTPVGHPVPTTQDSVSWTLFAAMLRNDVEPHEVIQESAPGVARPEVDTWLAGSKGKDIAIEFKYERNPRGGGNQPQDKRGVRTWSKPKYAAMPPTIAQPTSTIAPI